MSRRSWKHYQPNSLRDALEGCKDFARDRQNKSVERIAAEMGLADHWVLYKWLQNGRMPTSLLIAYEKTCGINLVSRWLSASSGKLLIDMPTGRQGQARDIQALQNQLHQVTGLLMDFYESKTSAERTLEGIHNAMQSLAWHRGNVQQHRQPQLEL
ncbi:hypothetical protein BFW38_06335 [Terasakiispira papahanaumokuakeensis]|uniref:Uncharacterized protein n=1 Tax=Terasakiispira papahanaumokuakeensis TaxID=197479 RepID=A0A1E2V8A2_9GAMM|nr:hypothetical protein [Terasakiispira papahanaumokuakeensis]ODC03217.1 hypothetical protein BFW38_06335 [Terasakiispira papahanaumokuakeensis]